MDTPQIIAGVMNPSVVRDHWASGAPGWEIPCAIVIFSGNLERTPPLFGQTHIPQVVLRCCIIHMFLDNSTCLLACFALQLVKFKPLLPSLWPKSLNFMIFMAKSHFVLLKSTNVLYIICAGQAPLFLGQTMVCLGWPIGTMDTNSSSEPLPSTK